MEDDCYVDQTLDVDEMPPAIASLDGAEERVIYIATFSKIPVARRSCGVGHRRCSVL